MDLHQKLIISEIITFLYTILIDIEESAVKIINKINQTSFNALIIIWPV